MGDEVSPDVFHCPAAQARVAALLTMPKSALLELVLAPDRTTAHLGSRAALMRWRKPELAWAIAQAEFTQNTVRADPVTPDSEHRTDAPHTPPRPPAPATGREGRQAHLLLAAAAAPPARRRARPGSMAGRPGAQP